MAEPVSPDCRQKDLQKSLTVAFRFVCLLLRLYIVGQILDEGQTHSSLHIPHLQKAKSFTAAESYHLSKRLLPLLKQPRITEQHVISSDNVPKVARLCAAALNYMSLTIRKATRLSGNGL